MKRNGCCVTITMESYTDTDKIKRALIPFSKFKQEWIPANADNPITAFLTTDNIYETQPRNELYGMTYSFSFVFDLLVSALNQQNGVIEMSMDYLTILGNLGHCKFEFSRKPVPKGEKPSKYWLRKEEEARRQIATEKQQEERCSTESPKDFWVISFRNPAGCCDSAVRISDSSPKRTVRRAGHICTICSRSPICTTS